MIIRKTYRHGYKWKPNPVHQHDRSMIIPYIAGETDIDRHIRRLSVNLAYKSEVESWCADHGWQVDVSEEGHYWDFRRGGTYCQWRPKFKQWFVSRRLVEGRDVLDYQQAIAMLETYTKE